MMQVGAQRNALRSAAAPSASRFLASRPAVKARSAVLRRAAEGSAPAEGLFELTKENYWEYLKADEQKGMVIVVDCYTDWCGPCKMIYPDLVKYSAELEPRGRIVKFNCNKHNKELGVTLKIKVAPTFLVYRNGEKVGDMTGAKLDKLKALVNDKLTVPVLEVASN